MHKVDSKEVDRRLRGYAAQRARLDVQEARDLLICERQRSYVDLGFPTMLAYMDQALGYGPKTALDRLRVAHALVELPAVRASFEAGGLAFSAVREISRVATPATETKWIDAVAGKTVRDVEAKVAGRRKGDLPTDPPRPELRRHVLRYEVSPETFTLYREARRAIELELGHRISDDELIAILCRTALERGSGRDPGRASHQIALIVCEECKRGHQDAAGITVDVPPTTVERAECDAQHIGRVDTDRTERARQPLRPMVRRQVVVRDHGRCTFPGCQSARYLEVHHIVHHADGGSDEPGNLTLLCGAHHRMLHDGLIDISGKAPHHLQFESRAERSAASRGASRQAA